MIYNYLLISVFFVQSYKLFLSLLRFCNEVYRNKSTVNPQIGYASNA